jgi:anaerobic ribonucleoside-triphosphate reductase activating protein
MIRIHQNAILHGTRANGPELRTCIWLQGCSLNCPGCHNPATHPLSGGTLWESQALARHIILHCAVGTKGITVSGGEPMQQADELLALILAVKAYRPDFSVGIFSGYTHRELADGAYWIRDEKHGAPYKRQLWLKIREHLDFAILGRWDRTKAVDPAIDTLLDQRPDLRLVSSSNQEVVLFSLRYSYGSFENRSCEYSIDENGLTQITGYAL